MTSLPRHGELREGIAVLGSLGEKGYLSTEFGTLAQVLFEQGRFDEAENLARLSQDVGASDDVATQALWRQVRAKLLAREGRLEDAVALAEEAVAITAGTDYWDTPSGALVDLGEVYRLAGRTDDAARALGDALAILERKGAVVIGERVRSKLAAVEADI